MKSSRISSSSDSNSIEVGSVVVVQTTSGSKNGVVKYVGETKFAAGEWIGVRLEGPEGKNDGTVSGERYFECEPLYGIFVKRAQVKLESKLSSSSSTPSAAAPETSKSGTLTAREKYEQLKAKRLAGAASTVTSKVGSVESTKEKEKPKETKNEVVKEVKEEVNEVKKEDHKVVKEVNEIKKEDPKKAVIESKVDKEFMEVKETRTDDAPSTSNDKENNKVDKEDAVGSIPCSIPTNNNESDDKTKDTSDKIDIDALRNRIDDLNSQLVKSKDEQRALNESLSRLKIDTENERKKLEGALSGKEEELSIANEKATKEKEEKEKVEKRLAEKETEMSQAIAKYEQEISQALHKFTIEREKLEMIISDKDKEIKEIYMANSNKSSSDPPPAPLTPQAPSAEDIIKIKDEIKSQTLKEADIKYSSIIDGKNNEIKKVQDAMKEASSKQEEVSNQLTTQKRELEKLVKDYESEKKKSNDVEAQLKEMKVTVDKANSNSSAATKVDQLQAQIDELNDNLELLTLDKEQLTLDKEILEDKINKLEKDLTIALESDNNTGAAAYAEENAKLRAALLKLNALSNEERSLSERHKKDLEELSGAVKQREQEVAALREFKSTASDQITDLKAHVDATALYEEMIEKLTERNDQLASRNKNLEEAIRDLEATVEVSEELDTSQREEIAKLNKAVDAAEVAKGAVEEQYKILLTKFDEATEIINKFRRSADSLRDELSLTKSMYEEAVAGTQASSDLLRETNLLKIKFASLKEKMIATEKSKREIESLMWSMKVHNSRYDEVFSTLSLTNSERKRLSVEVTVTLAAYKSACSFKDLFLCIEENKNSENENRSSLIANYADIYVVLMRAVAGLWQLSIKAMTEDEDTIMLPSTLSDFIAEIDRFSTTGENLNLTLVREFVSQAEDGLPPSLSSLLDECLHHCTSVSNSNDISPVHVMIHISALANLILFASNHLSSVLTVSDVEISNILKSIKLEIQELLDSTVQIGPSVVVSLRNFLCNAFVMLNKIVELTSNNQDSSVIFVNLKTTLSFVRNAANLLKAANKDESERCVVIFNINKPQNIWKMIIEGYFLGSENLRWKKAMATAKLTLGSWEESGKSIKGLQESLEDVNITLSLRSDELKAAKAANEELLGLLNKETEQSVKNDEVTVLREAIGVLEGRYANLENENRLLKKSTKLPVDNKASTARTEGSGNVDSSLVNSLTISRLNWKKMATIRLAASLQPLPSESRPSSTKSIAIANLIKINRIARKARASIKIASLGGVSTINNNDYSNVGRLKECWVMLTAC